MTRPPRVLLFTSALGGGGAERHTVRILPELRRWYDVELALSRREGPFLDLVPRDVPLHDLGGARMAASIVPLARLLAARRPDLVMSIQDHASVAASLARMAVGAPVPALVVNVQNTVSQVAADSRLLGTRLVHALLPALYRRADGLVAISQGVADDLCGRVPALRGRMRVIHNAGLTPEEVEGDAGRPADLGPGPVLLAVGRLVAQKGYPDLLRAFARVRRERAARLVVLGVGPEAAALEALSRELGIEESVRFLGFRSNPQAYMRHADVFVLSSHYEGFGNVIIEAMMCGAPVVSTDCPSGPSEILDRGRVGVLVPPGNPDALARALIDVLADDERRRALSVAGPLRARDFVPASIAREYHRYFEEILARRSAARTAERSSRAAPSSESQTSA